jgi:putative nucleotidyltransferase with HDIG domain
VKPSNNLRKALDKLDSLPPIPSIAQKILSLKITTDEGDRALLELINNDPAILSKIIGLANSPLFGTGRKILVLKEAAQLLGSKRVKMIALSFAMMSSMTRKSGGMLDIGALWRHSLAVAMTMGTLARFMPIKRRPSDEEIYLSGLLHDIGFLVLDYLDARLSDQLHTQLAAEPDRPVVDIEAGMLATNHSELGAELGRRWALPEPIIAVIRYHHAPDDKQAAVGQPLVTMTYLAGKLLPTLGISEAVQTDISAEEWLALGIDPLKEEEIRAKVQEHAMQVAEMSV